MNSAMTIRASARRLLGLALAVALAATGCVVGPDYHEPKPALDSAFVNAPGVSATPASADIAAFWRGFGDADLSALIERGLAVNGDVRIAQARLQESRATLQGAQAPSSGRTSASPPTSGARSRRSTCCPASRAASAR